MGKHTKKSKKKHIVKKRVQKMKELTAQDLYMNPALLYSPEFKALPLEKQFQLTSQLKMMSRGALGAPTVAPPGADPNLYHRYNDSSNTLQRIQNANEQLRIGIQANNDAIKEANKLKQEIKEQGQWQKDKEQNQNRAGNKLYILC